MQLILNMGIYLLKLILIVRSKPDWVESTNYSKLVRSFTERYLVSEILNISHFVSVFYVSAEMVG
jgi:hypothetical protein